MKLTVAGVRRALDEMRAEAEQYTAWVVVCHPDDADVVQRAVDALAAEGNKIRLSSTSRVGDSGKCFLMIDPENLKPVWRPMRWEPPEWAL